MATAAATATADHNDGVEASQASAPPVVGDLAPRQGSWSTWKAFTRVRAAVEPYTWHRTAASVAIGAGPAIEGLPDCVTDAASGRAWLGRVTEQCIGRLGLGLAPVNDAVRAVLAPTVLTQRVVDGRPSGFIHSNVLGALRNAFTGFTVGTARRGEVRAAVAAVYVCLSPHVARSCGCAIPGSHGTGSLARVRCSVGLR